MKRVKLFDSGSTAQSLANSRMWRKPATPKQISALKSTKLYDGKYYSRGRAGQTIGNSIRASGKSTHDYGFRSVGFFGTIFACAAIVSALIELPSAIRNARSAFKQYSDALEEKNKKTSKPDPNS
ncbi:MAG: hypothetical protein LBP89_03810 [Helicobacteraceae bacterium]|nr:hypothetical protein [Helicobacteraceae bacterium]